MFVCICNSFFLQSLSKHWWMDILRRCQVILLIASCLRFCILSNHFYIHLTQEPFSCFSTSISPSTLALNTKVIQLLCHTTIAFTSDKAFPVTFLRCLLKNFITLSSHSIPPPIKSFAFSSA